MRHRWVGLLLVTVALLLTGCSDTVDRDQAIVEPEIEVTLEAGHSVGQTFVARHAGLDGIDIWLDAEPGGDGELRLHLLVDPHVEQDAATAVLPLAQVTAPGFYRFSFTPLPDSHGRYCYAFLELAGEGQVRVGAGPGEAYLDGALHRDHQPSDVQVAFHLAYDPTWILLDLGQAAMGWLGLLGMAGLLYVVPGWALLVWTLPQDRLSWAEKLGIAAGLSLALYPLLLLWTDLVGLHLGSLYAWLPVAIGLAVIAWRYRAWRPRRAWETLREWARSQVLWPDLALLAVLGLVFGVRLLVVRSLDVPMWGDSYQHTLIAQLLVDHGGLFDSWEPYVPYRSFTVQFGFPVTVALWSWITGAGSVPATIWVGQLINGMAALTLYPLAVRVADGNRWAGVGAVLVAGLLSPMPAEYINWGRYAQLAGQAILPVAIWLLWRSARGDKELWKAAGLAGLSAAGMALTYYRMPFYYGLFILAWLLGWGLPHWGRNIQHWLKGLARLVLIAGLAVLFFLPWGLQVAGSQLATALQVGVSRGSPLESVVADYQTWRDLAFYVPQLLQVAVLIALIWSLLWRQWMVASLVLWIIGLALLVAGSLIQLPGMNMMQNFAVLIALYIPVGLLVGWLIGQIAWLTGRREQIRSWMIGVLVLMIAVGAARGQIAVVKPSYMMVNRPDMRAMAWIRKNTQLESRFLVEGFRIYEGYSAVGADAGWWIPLLAGRENTMPPQYALMNEVPAEPMYSRRVVDLVARLETTPPTSSEGVRLLCDWGITHVYIGQGQGNIGAGVRQLFPPAVLLNSPAFSLVYHLDRVYIFALDPQACGDGGQ